MFFFTDLDALGADHLDESLFESIKHINEYGQEYWTARELQSVLEYVEWRKFKGTVEKAIEACEGSNINSSDHFVEAAKMVSLGSGSEREVEDYHLSRYACYLIAMNGDPRKEAIALAQTYFAVKTRQQELIENYEVLTEDEKRLAVRQQMKEHNKSLYAAAKDAGVETPVEYAVFTDYGYMGLYGGLKQKDIHQRKGLEYSHRSEPPNRMVRATQSRAESHRLKI